MKTFFGITGILLVVAFFGTLLYATLLGLYLAFSASLLLGLVVLVVEPAPLVIGLWHIFFGVDLAARFLATFS